MHHYDEVREIEQSKRATTPRIVDAISGETLDGHVTDPYLVDRPGEPTLATQDSDGAWIPAGDGAPHRRQGIALRCIVVTR